MSGANCRIGGGVPAASGAPQPLADHAGHAALPDRADALPAVAPAKSRFATWVAVAAVAVASVLLAIVMIQRSAPPPAPEATAPQPPAAPAAPGQPAVQPAASAGSVRLVTEPDGATITIDGAEVGTTPADIAPNDFAARRIRVAKRGFRAVDVRPAETQLRTGEVRVRLEPEAAGLTVSLSGSYPFEVVDGGRVISPAAERHTISLPGPRTLRLRSSEVMLDTPLRADSSTGRVSYEVPQLGRLTIRTPLETCNVTVQGRDLGFPPINEQRLAPGSYKVELKCPDGDTRTATVAIAAGQSRIEVIR